ncbi:divergent paired-related homeobox-like [Lepus europaeus]|uniref:divergent paired-related homeobox-like n=1 Tax=Lepus europaeus TaxID=9983 RepID=UPI002B49966D|nr:divergent paired-related homeobox-like [Lepus europaeus]
MSSSGDFLQGKYKKTSQRKRTIFTDEQLEDLNILFSKNPYPDRDLQEEVASKMNIDPRWCRSGSRTTEQNSREQNALKSPPPPPQEAQPQRPLEDPVTPDSFRAPVEAPARYLEDAYPRGLAYPQHAAPSLHPSIYPRFKVPRDPSGGHQIIHFGCCGDTTIYNLYPLWDPTVQPGPSSAAASLFAQSRQNRDALQTRK